MKCHFASTTFITNHPKNAGTKRDYRDLKSDDDSVKLLRASGYATRLMPRDEFHQNMVLILLNWPHYLKTLQ